MFIMPTTAGRKRQRPFRCADRRHEVTEIEPRIGTRTSSKPSCSFRMRRYSLEKRPRRLFLSAFLLALVFTPGNFPLVDAFMTATSTTTRSTSTSSYCRPRRRLHFPSPGFSRTCIIAHNRNEKHSISDNLEPETLSLPNHVAIICDGNSRWAQARGLPAAAGHAAGADRLVQVLKTLQNMGVRYCTLYCFSTENWHRPAKEIDDLMRVMEQTARRCRDQILASEARIKVLGDLDDERIPSGLRDILTQIQDETAANEVSQTVCLAINYGGRRDILNAAKRLAEDAAASSDPSLIHSLTEDDLSLYLGTDGIPDPDLLIRTSGEHRISNFLLWNIAYAEIYFTDTLWPDFDSTCLLEALSWFSRRHRRFGSREAIMNGTPSS